MLVYKEWVLAPDQGEQMLCIIPLFDQRLYTMTQLVSEMKKEWEFLDGRGGRKKKERRPGVEVAVCSP